ncbi:molybdopterin cofactor-binding domain-containing protein [Pedobacter sp. MW01-1-1]|uniref:molybdopterin cofactor-binding domain-containing protein n=1 Tax=Pedobacter sp. MW01-1-1 TaxID=3383027 RepID=UPI003FEED7F0
METALSRRNFLKISTLAGGGMLIGFSLFDGESMAHETNDAIEAAINMYIKIGADDTIILLAPNPEIGQGVKTSLPLILAEELEVDWKKIKVEFSPVDRKYGRQTAGGSGSVRGRFTELRNAGAAAKEMLIAAAAETWAVATNECSAENGYVMHTSSGKKLSYGKLASKAASLKAPEKPVLKDPKDFKYIGTRVTDIDAYKITGGEALFGIDTRRKGMLFGVIARAPAYGKTLGNVDDSAALKIAGVKKVVKLPNAVAVLATNTWAAIKGREALVMDWKTSTKLENSSEHFASFKEMLNKKSTGTPSRNDGDVDAAKQNAAKVLEVYYEIPTLSHGQMEPLNFYADVKPDSVELFGPTQVPGQLKSAVAKQLNIPETKITINSPRQGGGFGRKLMTDSGVEAAMVSAAAQCPVQIQWTREDDMQNDFYRPAEMYRYQAALSSDSLLSWHQSGVGIGAGPRGDSYIGGTLANYRAESQGLTSNTPTGWWRAPGANTLAFAAESFMDEVCTSLKKDPVAFRIAIFNQAKSNPIGKLNYDADKYLSVVNLVAEMSNWGSQLPGTFRGFATWFSFGSYAAQVVDIQMIDGKPRVVKVFCAVNCGRVINLSGAENQVQGAIVDGICHAMFPKITFVDGAVEQKNFYSYPMLRMNDAPFDVVVKFVDTQEPPTGLGEPGLPPVAPALGSAIFAATGQRLRKLPFMDYFNEKQS